MGRRAILFTCAVFLAGCVQCQNDTTEAPVVPTDYICRACVCKDGKVDCNDQGIENTFSEADWSGLIQMKPLQVDLSSNLLTTITPIVELPIEILNLSRNAIDTMEKAAFRDLQDLRVLDLSYNKLTSDKLNPHVFEGRYSPEEYEPLASMRTLSLAHNELHSLHQDLFEHLPELAELDLSGNPLVFIDHVTLIAISSLPLLKTLRLRSCQLTEIPDKFLHTPRFLARLELGDNQLAAVPRELEEAGSLVHLSLDRNPIQRLGGDEDHPGFPSLPKLEELHMCNMPVLTSIASGALSGLSALKRLHISFNPSLRQIDPKALARADDVGETFTWPPVKELYLQSNNLSEIDSRLISRWDQLDKLDVSNNPYLCDCSTQWMVDVLAPLVEGKRENASSDMVCQEPVEMRGFTMKHLHDIHRTMRCVDKYGNRPEGDGAILLGTLIGVLLAVPIMLSLVLLWRRGYCGWLGVRGPADASRAFYKRAPHDDNNYY